MVAETDRTTEVKPKIKYSGKVVKISLAGAVINIGVGLPAVIHISQLVSPTNEAIMKVEDVLSVGQVVDVWVKKVKEERVELTMIKPLDLEWRDIKKGMTVKGSVVRMEKFGAFVEIGAERPGLVHISEMAHGYVRAPSDVVKEGDEVEAQVLDVNRRKKQIKLSLKALQPEPVKEEEPKPVRPVTEAQPPRPKDKPVRRKKTGRKPSDQDGANALLLNMEQPQQVEAEPTAMEMALREAMEKAKTKKKAQDAKTKHKAVSSNEQEEILNRTLEQKARTS
jgi:predicted RNA-binding protein with RPS1 domain